MVLVADSGSFSEYGSLRPVDSFVDLGALAMGDSFVLVGTLSLYDSLRPHGNALVPRLASYAGALL